MNYLFGRSETTKEETEGPRKLQCKIGPSIPGLSLYNPNEETNPHFIDNEIFTGLVVVRVKDFDGITRDDSPPIPSIPYFESKKRMFSIQLSGRFKKEFTADDIVFGAEFEHKVSPPTGAWLAIKFANLIVFFNTV